MSLLEKMNLVPNKQLLPNVSFQLAKYRKKDLCVDNKVQKAIGYVNFPTCRTEKCGYISTNKTTSFNVCKMCKACCHLLNIPSKDQKPTIMLFGGTVHIILQKRRVATTKKKSYIHFWRNFSANQNQAQVNLNQKM